MQGPLAWALIVWRCSLVFSSVDKIVSVLIHLLPGMLYLYFSVVLSFFYKIIKFWKILLFFYDHYRLMLSIIKYWKYLPLYIYIYILGQCVVCLACNSNFMIEHLWSNVSCFVFNFYYLRDFSIQSSQISGVVLGISVGLIN